MINCWVMVTLLGHGLIKGPTTAPTVPVAQFTYEELAPPRGGVLYSPFISNER